MGSEVFNLAILLSLKDAASGGLDRAGARIRALDKDGKHLGETFEQLRSDLNRDLSIGGVGVAGLMMLKKGVDEAGGLETTVLNLRQAYQEVASSSSKSREQQEIDIRKIMQMATELGNQLQGNTSTYADIFTSMNKAGIEAEDTINGAGKAAAYLANVTGAIRKGTAPQMAEDLGSYGKMFDLKGKDWMSVVELFSALEDRFNIGSGSLVEASKYFFSTAKGVMNLRGLSGAEETAKLFAFSKRYAGREGSEAGTSLDALITQFIAHKEKLQALEKDKGIKLEFFDAKGNFKGVENMFAQLEKMKKLSPEERGERLNAIFGEQGSRIASAMVEQGVAGWRNITAEANKSVSVNDKINQQMQTYEAKTEALSGSWQNFKATAFTPAMESAKSFLDTGNSIVGSLQKFSAEHQGLMGTLTTFAAYGSTALVVYSAFKTLTTGIRLFRLASAFSRAEGLIPYLESTTTAATTATTAMTTATTRATGLRGAIQSISGSSRVKIGVQIASIIGIEYLIGLIQSEIEKAINAGKSQSNVSSLAKSNFNAFQQAEKDGTKFNSNDIEGAASSAWFTALNSGLGIAVRGNEWNRLSGFEKFSDSWKQTVLYPISKMTGAENKFTGFGYNRDKDTFARGFKEFNPELKDPRIMTAFLRQLDTRVPNKDDQKMVREGLMTAFPTSYSQALDELNNQTGTLTQSFAELSTQINAQNQNADSINQQTQSIQTFSQNLTDLQNPMTETKNSVTDLATSAQKVPAPMNSVASSANNASNALNSLSSKIDNWQPPTPSIQNYMVPQVMPQGNSNSFSLVPSRAIGGVVERDGMAMVHAGNIITPARVTKGLQMKDVVASSGNNSFTYAPQITINGADESSAQKFRAMLNKHEKEIASIVARRMQNGRVRS